MAVLEKTSCFTERVVAMQKKRIKVSGKHQITIPTVFFEQLGIQGHVDCYVKDNALVIRPVRVDDSGYFAEEILKDLVEQGYSGKELLREFAKQTRKTHAAVETLINEADRVASDLTIPDESVDDLFSDQEQE